MRKFSRLGTAAIMFIAGATAATAQETVEATVSADVVNRYIWRGQDLGEASLQPTLGISYKGLALSAWGSTELSNFGNDKEFDITLGYSLGKLNIGVTDYWFTSGNDAGSRYFMYDAHKTNHVFEANIGYDFGLLDVQWYTNIAGNDGVNNSGDRAYSSYVEATVPFKLGGLDWTATVGAVPFATSFYADTDGFAVTNIALQGTKDISITPTFSIPVFAGISANPATQKACFTFGITLKP